MSGGRLTLGKLEHVLEAVNHFEAAGFGKLTHISGVKEPLRICATQRNARVT